MPDFDRVNQIHQLANHLSSMPPQQPGGPRIPLPAEKRAQWAAELYDKFGWRVHPELGTMMLVPDPQGDQMMGGNRPQQMIPQIDAEFLRDMLRDVGTTQSVPELVALADRIEAAETEEQRAVVLADIHRENPGLIATARRHFDNADPARVFGQ